MNVPENPVHRSLESLDQAVRSWVEDADEGKLSRWLGRELDADGVPIRLAVPQWPQVLTVLAAARRQRGDWPSGCAEAINGLVLAALRFARPDGNPVLHDGGSAAVPPLWADPEWLRWYRGTGIAKVLGWWSGARSRAAESVPPPLPTWSASDRVLAILRPDWLPGGDFLAVDHRDAPSPCRLELFGAGRTWLGPEWGEGMGVPGGPASRPRLSHWLTSAAADLIEWHHRANGARITRSALLLRGRRLALLSILVERRGPSWGLEPTLRLSMPANVDAGPLRESRALTLTETGRRGAAHALPIAMPCRPYATERGSFRVADRQLILTQAPAGRRAWLPVLVSWDAARQRKSVSWRVLTVSQQSRPVAPDRAFAARVSWGRDETYVIYRNLGSPARSAFLGHQTAARFLVAEFNEDGDLKPIVTVE
jgi:hypothetical protein